MSARLGRPTLTGRQLLMAQRLRERRVELGLTQQQVVTRLGRAGLHTTNRTLSSLERGAGIDVAKLPELAVALDCTVTYLLGLTQEPHRWAPDHELDEHPPGRANSVPGASTRSWILGAEVPDRAVGLRMHGTSSRN
ncbi:MAG: helix-turn-helix transcriptional regulator [Actinomycetota bacterium]